MGYLHVSIAGDEGCWDWALSVGTHERSIGFTDVTSREEAQDEALRAARRHFETMVARVDARLARQQAERNWDVGLPEEWKSAER